jgi:plasmid replication initiation protein
MLKEKKESITIIDNDNYSKPNFLISAKYKSSLMANKVLAISLSRLQEAADSRDGVLVSDIKASEIKKLVGGNKGSFYKLLEKTAREMTGRTIGISDPESHMFAYTAVITQAVYAKGVFRIEYNRHLTKYLKEIKRNFTRLKLSVMLTFQNVYAFRLYEILKSEAYPRIFQQRGSNIYIKRFSIAELRFLLGVANAELNVVQNILNDKKNPDYEKAYQKTPEKVMDTWSDLKRYALDPAVKEINQISDIFVEYITSRSGYGGKIDHVEFKIVLISEEEENLEQVDNEIEILSEDDAIDQTYELFEGALKMKDVRRIVKEAECNFEKIKSAYEVFHSQQNINNITGFMIKAIQEGYQNVSGKTQRELTDYGDIEELESRILENGNYKQQTLI